MSTSIPGVPGPVNCVIHRTGDGRVECATHGFAVDANVPEPEKTERVRAHIEEENAKWKTSLPTPPPPVQEQVDWATLAKRDPSQLMAAAMAQAQEIQRRILEAADPYAVLEAFYEIRLRNRKFTFRVQGRSPEDLRERIRTIQEVFGAGLQ